MAQSFNLHVVFPPESCKPGLGVAHTCSTDFPKVLLYPPQFRTFFLSFHLLSLKFTPLALGIAENQLIRSFLDDQSFALYSCCGFDCLIANYLLIPRYPCGFSIL